MMLFTNIMLFKFKVNVFLKTSCGPYKHILPLF
jgi:hypothetical protein